MVLQGSVWKRLDYPKSPDTMKSALLQLSLGYLLATFSLGVSLIQSGRLGDNHSYRSTNL